ncbi:MAG: patatin-like phospholipase family protein [Deltaproteobacteria bacterium]|nr:patatin-like phospholipase family protein [Deltaproteobacteria bacterium]
MVAQPKIALVLSGGGARGAYEAGVISYLREKIMPDRHGFAIHSGTSAGAINTCFLAATADAPKTQGKKIRQVWEKLRSSDIYRGDFGAVTKVLARAAGFGVSHLFSFVPVIKKWGEDVKPFQGLLDTSPFIPFLKKNIPFENIRRNVQEGPVDAVSITTTNAGSGKMELFINKKENCPYTGAYRIHMEPLDWTHPMASAAVPLIFPPVRIGAYFYVDGSIRQNTPMSPAVQLGADKVFIVGLTFKPSKETTGKYAFRDPNAYPSFTHLAGKLLNALFLDHIDYDLEQMTRINRIIEWSQKVYGPDYLKKLNEMLRAEGIEGDIANRGLKKIESYPLFPSEDFGSIATERLLKISRSKNKLSSVERFFLKFMEIDPNADLDLLSYLMFDKEYIGALIETGIRDARAHESELGKFLT